MDQVKQKRTNGNKLNRCLYELQAKKAANQGKYELAIILYTRALDFHERYGNKSNDTIKKLIDKYKANI